MSVAVGATAFLRARYPGLFYEEKCVWAFFGPPPAAVRALCPGFLSRWPLSRAVPGPVCRLILAAPSPSLLFCALVLSLCCADTACCTGARRTFFSPLALLCCAHVPSGNPAMSVRQPWALIYRMLADFCHDTTPLAMSILGLWALRRPRCPLWTDDSHPNTEMLKIMLEQWWKDRV